MAFTANIGRARAFLTIFDRPGGKPRTAGRPSDAEKELLRATAVFAVGALDAYLHDLVLEVVPKRGSIDDALTEALRNIAKEDPGLALRVALTEKASSRQAEFRKALDKWLAAKSFHGPAAVARALGYVGHASSLPALEPRIGSGWEGHLTRWTEMRHRLVHRGETPYIRRADAGECVDLIGRIHEAIDTTIAGDWEELPTR